MEEFFLPRKIQHSVSDHYILPVKGSTPLLEGPFVLVWPGTYRPDPVKGSAPPVVPVPAAPCGTYLPPPVKNKHF